MISGLGNKLHTLRLQNNMSQKQVGFALGISASIISNYESGERTPSVENIRLLAKLFHCSTDYLLGIVKSPSDKTLDCSMLTDEQFRLLQEFMLSLQR